MGGNVSISWTLDGEWMESEWRVNGYCVYEE